jgi:hypothetical protein
MAPQGPILFTGELPKIEANPLLCIWIYLVRGSEVLAEAEPAADGSFSFAVSRDKVLGDDGTGGVEVVVGPGSLKKNLARVPNVARVPIEREALENAERSLTVRTDELELSEEVLALWLQWCRRYCVSGVVVAPDGCPVPAAVVTVYTVGLNSSGFTKQARATVTADATGHFTACFCWCTSPYGCSCWPCAPFWWLCWPWWWERDMLHIIETLEQVPAGRQARFSGLQTGAVLMRPEGRALIRGQGFPGATGQAKPDAARTALLQRKLADARLREVFPRWWWCCDDPNLVFSATQNGVTIVNENPATETRWCLPSGSSVTLVAGRGAITACPGAPPPPNGFVWTRVGNITVNDIQGGYADGSPGSDASDMAFTGSLSIYGEFAVGTASYYQVNAGQWTGNPSRGGLAPSSSAPISAALSNTVYIGNTTTGKLTQYTVQMGPFSASGYTNLYATEEARQAGPTPPGLSPFPSFDPGAGDFVVWAFDGLIVSTDSQALIGGGSSVGAVDLTVTGYDADFNPVALVPDAPLTLEIDNTGLTTATINSLQAFTATGQPVLPTTDGGCSAYDLGPGGYVQLAVTVLDNNGHIYEYELDADYGQDTTDYVQLRGYSQSTPPSAFPPAPYGAPNVGQKSFVGGTEVITFKPTEDCCYDFRLAGGKRTTNGDDIYPAIGTLYFITASLKVSS